MEQIVKDITGLVGGTPLLEAARFGQARGLSARLLCKLEYLNPTGSVKDRAALWMLQAAEREGRLAPGATIIEPTSGNTGIGLAAIGASRGYRVILTMPETMSQERRDLLKAYGAQIVLTPGDKGMYGAMQKAAELAASLPGSFIPGQFENPHNAQAHYESTGPELWEQAGGSEQLVNGRTAFDAMRRGDASAKAVVDGYVHYLCVGITSIVNIFQPEVLCVGGGISREGEAVMAPVRAYVGKYGYARGSAKQPRIVAASLAGDAGIIGAALLGTEKK